MSEVLKSLAPAYGGYSIARDGKVIFIRGAIPGELVEVEIVEKKRDYSVASVVSVVEPSEDRVEPGCPVFGICGGCQLQFISYGRQLAMKREILRDSLTRLGGIETEPGAAFSGSQWNYRHRAQFKVSRQGEIGFFRESTRDVVVFDECPLMIGEINDMLQKIKDTVPTGGLREIHIASGDSLTALLRGDAYNEEACRKIGEAGVSGVAFNDALAGGTGYVTLDVAGLKYSISPWTFFQAHWALNRNVVDFIVDSLQPIQGGRVLDLYAGAGNFSLPLAAHGAEVVAVEENPHAADDAARNLEVNGIKNCRIIRSSAERYKLNRKFDVIILDPPRPGLTSEVAKKVIDHGAPGIVYVSCNPSTLARDLKKMKDKYDVESVHQIDFFPNTFHIEAAAFLRIR
ncbi:MAG: class I SAM-dependent RNA methyltransferase [Candidatus Sulfobium sp.]|jgi:23S rRNA (uracil1939-C5)-methyltransferase